MFFQVYFNAEYVENFLFQTSEFVIKNILILAITSPPLKKVQKLPSLAPAPRPSPSWGLGLALFSVNPAAHHPTPLPHT